MQGGGGWGIQKDAAWGGGGIYRVVEINKRGMWLKESDWRKVIEKRLMKG